MVECEYLAFMEIFAHLDGFNRYMVECESILTAQQLSEILVLIDTWWNVNILTPQSFGEEQLVLIDTWWNVNINNYDSNIRRTNVLIDTWWNVNKNFSFSSFFSSLF